MTEKEYFLTLLERDKAVLQEQLRHCKQGDYPIMYTQLLNLLSLNRELLEKYKV